MANDAFMKLVADMGTLTASIRKEDDMAGDVITLERVDQAPLVPQLQQQNRDLEKVNAGLEKINSELLATLRAKTLELATAQKQLSEAANPLSSDTKDKPCHYLYHYDGTTYAVGPFPSPQLATYYGKAHARYAEDRDELPIGVVVFVTRDDSVEVVSPE